MGAAGSVVLAEFAGAIELQTVPPRSVGSATAVRMAYSAYPELEEQKSGVG